MYIINIKYYCSHQIEEKRPENPNCKHNFHSSQHRRLYAHCTILSTVIGLLQPGIIKHCRPQHKIGSDQNRGKIATIFIIILLRAGEAHLSNKRQSGGSIGLVPKALVDRFMNYDEPGRKSFGSARDFTLNDVIGKTLRKKLRLQRSGFCPGIWLDTVRDRLV